MTALQRRSIHLKRAAVTVLDNPVAKKRKSRQEKKADRDRADQERMERGGGSKGSGKGKRGKSKTSGGGCAKMTPEGKPVCFAFNNESEKCMKIGCRFQHVCGVCFKPKTPMYDCKHEGLQ